MFARRTEDGCSHKAGEAAATLWKGSKQVFQGGVGIFLANRQISDGQLLVDGERAASWRAGDRARSDRFQREIEKAQSALNVALAEMAKPYRLAPEVARLIGQKMGRVGALVGWGCVALAGVTLGSVGGFQAAQPDAVLLERVMRASHHVPPPPTGADERMPFLIMIGFGVALLLWGLAMIGQRRRAGRPQEAE